MQTYIYLQRELKERFSKGKESCKMTLPKGSRNWALPESELWLSQCGLLGKLKIMSLFQCVVGSWDLLKSWCQFWVLILLLLFFFNLIGLYLAMPNYLFKIENNKSGEKSKGGNFQHSSSVKIRTWPEWPEKMPSWRSLVLDRTFPCTEKSWRERQSTGSYKTLQNPGPV